MNQTDTATLPKKKEKKPETFCLFCGMPMAREEMGVTISDPRAAEWDEKTFANVVVHGCSSCWKERKQWLEQGIRGADERKKAAGIENC